MSGTLRPRYGRIAAFSAAVTVTSVALLGGVGLLPTGSAVSYAVTPAPADDRPKASLVAVERPVVTSGEPQETEPVTTVERTEPPEPPRPAEVPDLLATEDEELKSAQGAPAASVTAVHPLPRRSGSGRRVVFDQSEQRVWLVGGGDRVRRTYPVSGSLHDNLDPGSYTVYSRSRHAIGIDESGTMQFMVRFAHGDRAAIGFHDIPVLDGERVQTREELGTPRSHGCVRQWRPDAKALWDFAPVGSTVVVVA